MCVCHADWLYGMVDNGLFLLFCISLLACSGGVTSLFIKPIVSEDWKLLDECAQSALLIQMYVGYCL